MWHDPPGGFPASMVIAGATIKRFGSRPSRCQLQQVAHPARLCFSHAETRLATRPRGFAGGDGAHLVPGALNLGAGGIEIVGGFT